MRSQQMVRFKLLLPLLICSCHGEKSYSESGSKDSAGDSAEDTAPDTSEDSGMDTVDHSDSGPSEECSDGRYTEPDARMTSIEYIDTALALGDFNGDGHQDWGTGRLGTGFSGHLIPGPSPLGEFSFEDIPEYSIAVEDDLIEVGSLGRAGDVDGNGVDDVLFGAWLFMGPVDRDLDRSSAATVFGQPDGASYRTPRNPGDVDGDGLMDILIGSHYYPGVDYGGQAFLITDAWRPRKGPYDMDRAVAIIRGEPDDLFDSGDLLGRKVAFAGDTNADGYGDILLSYDQDSIYAFFDGPLVGDFTPRDAYATIRWGGSLTPPPYGGDDMNGDGVDDIIIISNCIGIVTGPVGAGDLETCASDIVFTLNDLDDRSLTDAAPGGDLDGDGTMDLLVASYGEEDDGIFDTVVRVIPGPLDGDLTEKDVSQTFHFCSSSQTDLYKSISKAEDLDSNGLPDILASVGPGGFADESFVYLLFGESL